jgi:peptide/nickel transport system permease protein
VTTGAADLLAGGDDNAPGLEPIDGAEQRITARSPLQLFWRRLRRDRVAMVALVFIVLILLVAIFAPLIVDIAGAPDPSATDRNTLDDFGLPSTDLNGGAFNSVHLFGVDGIGRDVFSRTVYGARASLAVAFISSIISVTIGVVVGMVAGYYRGWVDSILSRIMDIQLAFPVLLLAIGLGAACSLGEGCLGAKGVGFGIAGFAAVVGIGISVVGRLRGNRSLLAPIITAVVVALAVVFAFAGPSKGLLKPGLPVVIFVIALSQWPYIARIIRGQVLSLREKEFIEAARSLGASNSRIIFKEILPNLVAPIIVYSTVLIPTNILFEAALSFLGVGVQPPTPSWGAMISEATSIFQDAWWFMLFPGLALLFTVLAFNLIGDGLQDALNPRAKK